MSESGTYDRDSFIAGLAVGRTLWKPLIKIPQTFSFTISNAGYIPQQKFEFEIYMIRLQGRIYWGDGTHDDFNDLGPGFYWRPRKKYSDYTDVTQVYTITIVGEIYEIQFVRNTSDPAYLVGVNTPLPSTLITARNLFRYCRHLDLNGLSPLLFSLCSQVKDFSYCFYYANGNPSNYFDIPEGFFDNCEMAEDFTECFREAYVGTIPGGLFNHCGNIKNVSGCFENARITEIPEGLFDNCTDILDASFCFFGCTRLQSIPAGIFAHNPSIMSFQYTFGYCYPGLTSDVPLLWDSHPDADGTECFEYCRNAGNYNDIPESWGGPAP